MACFNGAKYVRNVLLFQRFTFNLVENGACVGRCDVIERMGKSRANTQGRHKIFVVN